MGLEFGREDQVGEIDSGVGSIYMVFDVMVMVGVSQGEGSKRVVKGVGCKEYQYLKVIQEEESYEVIGKLGEGGSSVLN